MPANAGASRRGSKRAHVGGRPVARSTASTPLDRLQHARDAAERERRRAEPDDFAIVGAREPPDDLNRIGRRIGVVEVRVQPVERRLQRRVGDVCHLHHAIDIILTCDDAARRRSRRRRCSLVARGRGRLLSTCARSLPQIDGTVTVAGLSAPIDIVRDADAIPHIFAANKLDALFGLGYAHAQDRLWQMEFQRRIGHGRLSEDLRRRDAAAGSVSAHRRLRPRRAHRVGRDCPSGRKQQINAYVAGVNAFIATHHGAQLPPEFTLLRFEPEPWTGADVARLGEDDGVGPERELLVRAAAPRPARSRRRGADGAS